MHETLTEQDLPAAVEAILMVSPHPVTAEALAEATGHSVSAILRVLGLLAEDYDGELSGPRRGFELRQHGGAWRLYSRSRWAPWVGKFVVGTETSHLSKPALETLAIVAYRQPITRGQIARIRGVNVDGVLRTLMTRGLVEEVGASATGAHLLTTTDMFLQRMGLASLDDLPPLAPHVPGQDSVEQLAAELEEQ